MPDAGAPIGLFDSGVGGLTVLRAVAARLPHEPLVYLGDTARVPYGTKSAATVERYAEACTRWLQTHHAIKLLVVACNTASAYAVPALRAALPMPVVDVVAPGAQAALAATRNGHIGVVGTPGTIGSRAYETALHAHDPALRVSSRACPLFVPLAEEGWTEGDVPRAVAREYLTPLCEAGVDTLVLGCTHYPLLKATIAEVCGDGVTLVDSAEATAAAVAAQLDGVLRAVPTGNGPPARHFYVSDAPDSFGRVGRRFLGADLPHIDWIDF